MFGRKKLLARIDELEAQVKRLENMHAAVRIIGNSAQNKIGYFNGRLLTIEEIERQSYHPQPKHVDYKCLYNVPASTAETDRISKVTLEELARLVIDGTPIRREEEVQAKRFSEYTEDNTTRTTIIE